MIDYGDIAWPPTPPALRDQQRQWTAWWRGDHDKLKAIYSGTSGPRTRPSQHAGGVVGAISRFFWGQPSDATQRRQKLHVPIAADIATASADLLFGDELHIETPGLDEAARKRLDEILDANNFLAVLHEAATRQACDVGVYLRVTTDAEVDNGDPIISMVSADAAIPTFRWGRLRSVQFWHVVKRETGRVWRHIEEWRPGEVEHALYAGTDSTLGRRVPLTEASATADLAVGEDATIATDGMCVAWIPSIKPGLTEDGNLGRADWSMCIDEMDALDQCLTDWIRDIHAARARILTTQSALRSLGPGQGAYFDADADVFVGLNLPPAEGGGMPVTVAQFAVDVQRHKVTFDALLDIILRSAGYSPATFGIVAEGAQMTATEVKAREGRSASTREKKTRAWTNPLEDLIDTVARIAGLGEAQTTVEFPASAQPSQLELAQVAQTLRSARAASTRTLVILTQPDLEPAQIEEEVARIMAEDRVADPILIGTPSAPIDGQTYDDEGDDGDLQQGD